MQSSMLFCYHLQLVELFGLGIHQHIAKNMKLKQVYFAQNVVTGNIGKPTNQVSGKFIENSQRNGSWKLLLEMKCKTRFDNVMDMDAQSITPCSATSHLVLLFTFIYRDTFHL